MAVTPDGDRGHLVRADPAPLRRSERTGLSAVPMTELLGRDELSTEVQALVRRPTVRLVTLTGPGGVGKTRVAADVAAKLLAEFDTVAFVPLASVRDPELVPVTIARELAVDSSDETTANTLQAYLGARTTLLVLDNIEHLLDAAPALIDLLGAAAGLTVLVTSRTLLRVSGEHVVNVPPLALPDLGPLATASELVRFAAVRLFEVRCAAVCQGFVVTDDNAADVVEICRRLDALPLAIELAAARASVLPPAALLSRLRQRLALLTQGAQDQPARLRTMRAGITWSYDLLSPAEKYLFRRLAVFAGDFSLDAAEIVGGNAGGGLDVVSSLIDKSLLAPTTPRDGEPRFVMLEIIREYAEERLTASGDGTDARRAHATYFTDLAERAEPDLRGPTQQRWRDALEAELSNLRAALAWTLGESSDPADAELGLRVVGALWYFWFQRGLTGEARRWLTQALTRSSAGGRPRAQALLGVGTLAWRQGDCVAAREYLDQSVSSWREAGDVRGRAETLHVLGHVTFDQGEFELARGLFEDSSAGFREASDPIGGLPLAADLGMVAYHQGDYTTAEEIFRKSLAVYRRHALKDRIAGVLNALGDLARLAGDYARAAALYEESMALWRELHGTPGIASALHKLGQVSRATQDTGTARAQLTESLNLQQDLGNRQGIGECLAALAPMADKNERAAQIFAASSALLTSIGVPLAPADQLTLTHDMTAVRKRLGQAAWDAAWAVGSVLSVDEAVRLALHDDECTPAAATGSSATRPPGPDVSRLSRREREVCQLLAGGHTNREIASALSISEKTVGSHIEHIMTKLGVRSRTRIALWAAEHGMSRAHD
jgi:predicted ATPase/DNA-binding CsgD family transcriptional regulator